MNFKKELIQLQKKQVTINIYLLNNHYPDVRIKKVLEDSIIIKDEERMNETIILLDKIENITYELENDDSKETNNDKIEKKSGWYGW
jgi:hypothetical protein